ncbi:NtaA/DmoA family FMN-dependent monooxygenase [Nocardia fusca]|uniref:NtaA/DmoA family FMN-dependent monooxygenase n=1 Tax=Nocardia fusca TaxID=941183 RepID=UPI0037C76BB7
MGGGGGGSAAELWRHPEVPIDASINLDWYIRQARQAEEALFDFVFVTDSQYIEPTFTQHHLNRLEPLTLLSAVATYTSRIGLAATVTTSYTEPFDIARRLASLDLISGGRAGWNIVTSYDSGTAGNFSRADHGDHAHRYRRGTEAVTVVHGLWNSYEDDAFASDKDAVSYLDTTRLHRLDHKGEFFSVTGPLNIQRSRQGEPVIIQAGTSEPGRELNARFAELASSFAKTTEWALAFAPMFVRGRQPTAATSTTSSSSPPSVSESATPTNKHWYRTGAADGFNLFAGEPEDFSAFRHRVIPLLQQSGLFRTDYESDTFRGNLQLPTPKNTHTLTEQSA